MSKTIRSILFDVDGVLIKPSSITQVFSQLTDYPEAKIANTISNQIQQSLLGKVDLIEVIKPHLDKWHWQQSASTLIDAWLQSIDQPQTNLLDYISKLTQDNFTCYVVSNKEKYRATYLLEHNKFNQLFNHNFFSYEMHCVKPEIKFWQYVWDSLQYLDDLEDKSTVVLIDDEPVNINSAKSFGFTAHLYTNLTSLEKILDAYSTSL